MLLNLHIENFLIIDRVDIDLDRGLNIITGETGSGKSMVFEALSLILGGKGGKDFIRNGENRSFLQATFDVENEDLCQILREEGFQEEDYLTVSREICQNGKNLFRVNQRMVSGSFVKSISDYLINISGQHEHQVLMDLMHHRKIIDEFGASKIIPLLEGVKDQYLLIQNVNDQLELMTLEPSELYKKIDFLKYQIEEIEKAKLKLGEDDEMESKLEFM